MASPFVYGTVADSDELHQLEQILTQCFNSPPSSESTFLKRVGAENVRVVRQNGKLAGGLSLLPMGQWYGGVCVPMTGIAGVGIAPEYRGGGAAIALMTHMLQELQSQGVPLSVLYPATQRLYRKAGYEQGGGLCQWEIEPNTIQLRDYSLPIHSIEADSDWCIPLYRQRAIATNGMLERNRMLWDEVFDSKDVQLYVYCIGSERDPEGYVVFVQQKVNGEGIVYIRDWSLLTPAAIRRFWTFLSDHRSQIDKVRWRSSPMDALTLLLPEQTARIRSLERWMLRLVNVTESLEKRGYPTHLTMELHLEVRDEVLPDNSDRFVLQVTNGKAEVKRGGNADLRLSVGSLASLYTGLFTPQQLQLTGHLEATETALLSASQLFAGSFPWMADFF